MAKLNKYSNRYSCPICGAATHRCGPRVLARGPYGKGAYWLMVCPACCWMADWPVFGSVPAAVPDGMTTGGEIYTKK